MWKVTTILLCKATETHGPSQTVEWKQCILVLRSFPLLNIYWLTQKNWMQFSRVWLILYLWMINWINRSTRSWSALLLSLFFLFECPRFSVGTQSTLNLSKAFAGWPETKWRLQTWSFFRICSVKSSLLIAAIHCVRRYNESSSASSPWLVSIEGTLKKELSLSRPLLAWQSTNKHRTITTSLIPRTLQCLFVHQHGGQQRLSGHWSPEWKPIWLTSYHEVKMDDKDTDEKRLRVRQRPAVRNAGSDARSLKLNNFLREITSITKV